MLALGESFQNVWSMKWQVTTDPLCRTFQDKGKHGAPSWKVTLTSLSWARVLSLLFLPIWWIWMQALRSAPRRGAALQSSRKGPLPEDGVNRLSLKVTSSGSGSSSQRKLQSFFRAVNAKRKMHWVTAFLHAPGQRSAFSQGISLPNKASFFFSAWTRNRPQVTFAQGSWDTSF